MKIDNMKDPDKSDNPHLSAAQREFHIAKEEYFKNKPKPKNEAEMHKEIDKFIHWYNYERKQSDTGKTPDEMYKEIYGEEDISEDVDDELIDLIEELQKYDDLEEEIDYEDIKKDLKKTIDSLILKGEDALEDLHFLIGFTENPSCMLALEIIRVIKSPKSIIELIEFVKENEYEEFDIYSGLCDEACFALTEIGEPSIEHLIKEIRKNIRDKEYYGYLVEALGNIKNSKVYHFFKEILENYLNDYKKYQDWFEIIPFVMSFHEQKNPEILPLLNKLLLLKKWDKDEIIEIQDIIFHLENPKKYECEFEKSLEEMKKSFEKFEKEEKVGRNEPCPCGSEKKYKKCCLDKEEK